MTFKSRSDYTRQKSFFVYPKTEPQYRLEMDEELHQEHLVVVGQTDVYSIKQESAKDCDIYKKLDQYERTGDASIFSASVDSFVDCTKMPQSLMEMCNIRARAAQLWAQAPLDVKERYGSNMELFVKDVDSQLFERAKAKQAAARAAATGQPTDGGTN